MRAHQFLIEYNRNKTAEMFGQQLLKAAVTGADRTLYTFTRYSESEIIQAVLDELEASDPTVNRRYVPWLAREYLRRNIVRIEDARVWGPDILTVYQRLRPRLPADQRDIMRLTWDQVFRIAAEDEGNQHEKSQERSRGVAEEVYKDDTARIIIPRDQDAACYYGRGSRWCTAATKSENQFDRYNQQGPLYIIIPAQPEYTGEKYQFHFNSEQYLNEKDEPFNRHHFAQRYPGVVKFFLKLHPVDISILFGVHITDPDLLDHIATNSWNALAYAREVIKGRWPKGEAVIAHDPEAAVMYAHYVLKTPWPRAEDIISKNAYASYLYAASVLKRPWPQGEDAIKKDVHVSRMYLKFFPVREKDLK